MLRMARTAHRADRHATNLCLAGGVALNCVGNGRILREGPFEQIWIQPAAGDAGGALGVAQLIWHRQLEQPRAVVPGQDAMKGAYLGPATSRDDEIERFLDGRGRRLRAARATPSLLERVAGHAGRREGRRLVPGPHGVRPARARRAAASSATRAARRCSRDMNIKIKFREGFRPFAPSVLRERVADYFELDCRQPYMLLVAPVEKERRIAAHRRAAARCGASTSSTCRARTSRRSPTSTTRRASRP